MIASLKESGLSAVARNSESFVGKTVHLIGIGGSGMQALAGMLLRCGATVSGSDEQGGYAIDRLGTAGGKIAIGQRPENVPDHTDLVVYSAAIK